MNRKLKAVAALFAGMFAVALAAAEKPMHEEPLKNQEITIQSDEPTREDIRIRWDHYAPEMRTEDSLVVKWNAQILVALRIVPMPPSVSARHMAVIHTAMYDAWAAYDDKAVGTMLGGSLRRPKAERTPANKMKAISYAAYLASVDQFPTDQRRFRVFMQDLGYDPDAINTDPTKPEGIGTLAANAVIAYRHNDGSNQMGDLNKLGIYTDYTGYKSVNTPGELNAITRVDRWMPIKAGNGLGGLIDREDLLAKLGAKPRQPTTMQLGGLEVQRFATPHWGNVIPFALESGDQFRPPAPLWATEEDFKPKPGEDNVNYSDIKLGILEYPMTFREQARQLLKFSANLTDREKCIADYWSDSPLSESPPGHLNVIAQYISRRDKHTLDQDVKLFFALNNAVMDAGIAAWDAKRYYDNARPITAIRTLFKGQTVTAWAGPNKGVKQIKGEDWMPFQEPFFMTPPFPDQVSGHSTFSHAAETVFVKFTGGEKFGGYVIIRPGASPVDIGTVPAAPLVLRWPTFKDMGDQASISRRYGGIHYTAADLEGRKLGYKVGEAVWARAQEYFNGTAQMQARPHHYLYPPAMQAQTAELMTK